MYMVPMSMCTYVGMYVHMYVRMYYVKFVPMYVCNSQKKDHCDLVLI